MAIWGEWVDKLPASQQADYEFEKVKAWLFDIRTSVYPPCKIRAELQQLLTDDKSVSERFGRFEGGDFIIIISEGAGLYQTFQANLCALGKLANKSRKCLGKVSSLHLP